MDYIYATMSTILASYPRRMKSGMEPEPEGDDGGHHDDSPKPGGGDQPDHGGQSDTYDSGDEGQSDTYDSGDEDQPDGLCGGCPEGWPDDREWPVLGPGGEPLGVRVVLDVYPVAFRMTDDSIVRASPKPAWEKQKHDVQPGQFYASEDGGGASQFEQ